MTSKRISGGFYDFIDSTDSKLSKEEKNGIRKAYRKSRYHERYGYPKDSESYGNISWSWLFALFAVIIGFIIFVLWVLYSAAIFVLQYFKFV